MKTLLHRLRRLFRPKIGLRDLEGRAIREGDELLVFVQDYAVLQEEALGEDVLVQQIDPTRPLPVRDVPMARGVCAWSPEMLHYELRVTWLCPAWALMGCATLRMGGGAYAFAVVEPQAAAESGAGWEEWEG